MLQHISLISLEINLTVTLPLVLQLSITPHRFDIRGLFFALFVFDNFGIHTPLIFSRDVHTFVFLACPGF